MGGFAAGSALRPTHSASLAWGRDVTPSVWGYHGDQFMTAFAHGQILALPTEDRTKAQSIYCLREQTPKPCPSLHPGLPCCLPRPNVISSGHDMWHLVTQAARGAEPSDTRAPQPAVTALRGVCCALDIPWVLPSPAHRLPCPSPAPLALQLPPATNLPSVSLSLQ